MFYSWEFSFERGQEKNNLWSKPAGRRFVFANLGAFREMMSGIGVTSSFAQPDFRFHALLIRDY